MNGELNKNSYISIGLAVMLIGATIWIKDGQSSASTLAVEVSKELSHYKELQTLTGQVLSAKIDALSELVNSVNSYSLRDHRIFVSQLHELNPELKIPNEGK